MKICVNTRWKSGVKWIPPLWTGNDFNAAWPTLNLNSNGFGNQAQQREGDRQETYQITFTTETGPYTYSTNDPTEFQQFGTGSRWILEVNGFNAVVSAQPAN